MDYSIVIYEKKILLKSRWNVLKLWWNIGKSDYAGTLLMNIRMSGTVLIVILNPLTYPIKGRLFALSCFVLSIILFTNTLPNTIYKFCRYCNKQLNIHYSTHSLDIHSYSYLQKKDALKRHWPWYDISICVVLWGIYSLSRMFLYSFVSCRVGCMICCLV